VISPVRFTCIDYSLLVVRQKISRGEYPAMILVASKKLINGFASGPVDVPLRVRVSRKRVLCRFYTIFS
jgi:hypothetical protein